jgi:ABC-type amino acid transport substrate-binding protein
MQGIVMPSIKRLLAGLLACGLAWAACAQNPVVTVAAEDDWAPYSSMKADKSGPEGFSPDLVQAVFKLKGWMSSSSPSLLRGACSW